MQSANDEYGSSDNLLGIVEKGGLDPVAESISPTSPTAITGT